MQMKTKYCFPYLVNLEIVRNNLHSSIMFNNLRLSKVDFTL